MLCKLSVSMKIFSHPNRIREKFTLKYAASMAVMLTVCLKKKTSKIRVELVLV